MWLAFTEWDGISPVKRWVGLNNFRLLFQDAVFWKALTNNLVWIAAFVTLPTALGLGIAVILNENVRFSRFLKISYYLPMVLSFSVVGLVWSWIYHPASGLLNSTLAGFLRILKSIGLPVTPESAFEIGWLSNPKLVLWALIGAAVWRQVGYVMILYLSGLKTLDPAVLEAGRVDGAEGWKLFRYVTFPMLAPVTTIVIVLSIIDALRVFDIVYVMTRGGPFHSSEVLANYMYIQSFRNYMWGYGSAIGVILFLLSLGFILIYLRQIAREEQ
ncbi:MAG: Binding-protein-dependent transport systems inner membrane component [Acetothermia bacterium 64_32]|nr:MAG: Binding-protein-dependent transport systems inner membrane component [Acetothermia bacterium 64_32]